MGNFKDVAVIDVLVKPGDAVEVEGPLVTLETEKATMDVPSTVAGIVEKILARDVSLPASWPVGDKARLDVRGIKAHLSADRAEEVPRRVVKVAIHFTVEGDVAEEKIERAIAVWERIML